MQNPNLEEVETWESTTRSHDLTFDIYIETQKAKYRHDCILRGVECSVKGFVNFLSL